MVEQQQVESRAIGTRIVHLVKLASIMAATAVVLAVATSQWQDWQRRVRERARLHELEAHAIGVDNPASPDTFYPVQVVPRPPIVTDFERLSVAQAEGKVAAEELVLAVIVDGEARAYPLNMLNGPMREVINDQLGGTAIAATW